jgi:hypothetical protein
MEQIIECIVVGGSDHGLVRRKWWDMESPALPLLAASDGQLCQVAARCVSGPHEKCYVLLHPRATGAQFTAFLQALSSHGRSACDTDFAESRPVASAA